MISFSCPSCDRPLQVPDELSAPQVQCPFCEAVVAIPPPDTGTAKVLRLLLRAAFSAVVGAVVVGVAAAVTSGGTEADKSALERGLGAAPWGALLGVIYLLRYLTLGK